MNNRINGMDVDKFDYIRRDALYLGAKDIFVDHEQLFAQAIILNHEICYPATTAESFANLLQARYKLYKNYYFDVTSKALEKMVADALSHVAPIFPLQQAYRNLLNCSQCNKTDCVYEFLGFTDHILDEI